jgi:hypothetical protein
VKEMHKIAIEPNLTPIKDYLSSKGYSVESINLDKQTARAGDAGNYDAYVVTGLNTNFMGIQDRETDALVIDAEGMTPEQIYNQLNSRLK